MRIVISSSDVKNPYAALIAQVLARSGYPPVGFLINETMRLRALKRYAKYYGWYRTWRRILHPPAHSSGDVLYIEDYLGDNHVDTHFLSIEQVAKEYGIRKVVGEFKSQPTLEFVKNNVDIVINAGGGIFPKSLIEAPRLGVINIHLGKLPDFRGVHTFEWSLWHNKPLEITIHLIAPGIDTGDILATKEFTYNRPVTIPDLKSQSIAPRTDLLLEVIDGLSKGTLHANPQTKGAGKQYYAMHPKLQAVVERKLTRGSV